MSVEGWSALGNLDEWYSRGKFLGHVGEAFALIDDGYGDAETLRVGRHHCEMCVIRGS